MKYAHDRILQKARPLKLTEKLHKLACFQFPKYRLVRCFKLFFTTQAYVQGGKWKKLLIDWNEYQENTTSIGFQFHSPKLSIESCFILCWPIWKRSTVQATDNFQRRQP